VVDSVDPLRSAGAALAADLARLSSISQNLVNAATPGYKRDIAFARTLALHTTAVDHKLGALRTTGGTYDVAIDGQGYFEVRTEQGPAYTRRGDFRVDAQGQLITQQGHVVQGLNGALVLAGEGLVSIGRDGVVMQGERRIGQLKVVAFENTTGLQRLPGGLFASPASPQPAAPGDFRLRHGQLEASNVDTASEMVRLVETMRHFEAMQKVVQGADEMTERALRKLGEF
jgi:flagellar basal-body rod protein FlgF